MYTARKAWREEGPRYQCTRGGGATRTQEALEAGGTSVTVEIRRDFGKILPTSTVGWEVVVGVEAQEEWPRG